MSQGVSIPPLKHLEQSHRRSKTKVIVHLEIELQLVVLGLGPLTSRLRPDAKRVPLLMQQRSLAAQNVKEYGRAQRVAHEMHLASEFGVLLAEESQNAVRLGDNNPGDFVAVRALI